MINILVDHGVDIEKPDLSGMTPLALAARAKNFTMAKALVRKGARLEAPDDRGHTPLAHACVAKDLRVATFLLQQGADPFAIQEPLLSNLKPSTKVTIQSFQNQRLGKL